NRSRIKYPPGLCGTSCTFFCRSGFSLVEIAIALPLTLNLALASKIDNQGTTASQPSNVLRRRSPRPPLLVYAARRRGSADCTIISSLTFSAVSEPTKRFLLSCPGYH